MVSHDGARNIHVTGHTDWGGRDLGVSDGGAWACVHGRLVCHIAQVVRKP